MMLVADSRPLPAAVVLGSGPAVIVIVNDAGETIFDGTLRELERRCRPTWRQRLAAWLMRR